MLGKYLLIESHLLKFELIHNRSPDSMILIIPMQNYCEPVIVGECIPFCRGVWAQPEVILAYVQLKRGLRI